MAKDKLPGLVGNRASNVALIAINKFEGKVSGKGAGRARVEKGFILFISNEDMNDIIKIIKSLEDSGLLIDCITESVKLEIKRQKDGFLGVALVLLAASLVQPVISSVEKGITRSKVMRIRKEVTRARRGAMRAGRGYYNNQDQMNTSF